MTPAKSCGPARWLLIGNSRWHWAVQQEDGLLTWHEPPSIQPLAPVTAWAAAGAVPQHVGLAAAQRLDLDQVPLEAMPPWLGVDRALVGWRAWQRAGAPVLVVDAGTALSFTRVDGQGGFRGGRLMAGAALQLRALAQATAQLPDLAAGSTSVGGLELELAADWPVATEAAMKAGVAWGLAAAIATAAKQAWDEQSECEMFLTGGDGTLLAPLVNQLLDPRQAARIQLVPDLALEALALLCPAAAPEAAEPQTRDQFKPRSPRI